MNPAASSRTFLATLLFIGLCLSSAAAKPAPDVSTATIKDGTSWKTVLLGPGNIGQILKAHPYPHYPGKALWAHVEGRGRFRLDFGPDGKVRNVEVLQSTGDQGLDDECLTEFREWRARHPGELQTVVQQITFTMHRPR